MANIFGSRDLLKLNSPVVLAVGEASGFIQMARLLPPGSTVTFSDITDIHSKFLSEIGPDIVLCCLVGQNFDFLELALVLQHADYMHLLMVIVPDLPNPNAVISEAIAMCPGFKIRFHVDTTVSTRVII